MEHDRDLAERVLEAASSLDNRGALHFRQSARMSFGGVAGMVYIALLRVPVDRRKELQRRPVGERRYIEKALRRAAARASRGRPEQPIDPNAAEPVSGQVDPREEVEANEEAALRTELIEHVVATFAELPECQRELARLFYLQGISRREIARLFGVPEGTIGSRLSKLRADLRRLVRLRQAREASAHS